ncbi:flagellar M-ring protein FliF [Roseobacter denitrificans]|uniref:Flagellar M-ring protein n=1 Tax=Roseobacter denitrificans (strain ATCC 33942 / OCh 114) TaxID=375451 RepID=Q16DE9_ROSDO|nr:flagellar basal-body MS-ring/collar protein FliF [Roseobacter denitrificans]ABG29994.1 flagellar M-ring protein FliF, putative [Roseobacter denitrificans OCh 114]AVL53200.1 flagellar M-ring protein FliF [Roseobacter denitrificans]SFF68550.1 flagellar M-ring protein FliF [Roseobacter denitrificans OCh 114]
MQQIVTAWTGLPLRRQVIVALATGAMFFAILAMSRMATAPNMTLLYAGLENGAAGDVVAALEQRGAVFEVRGGSIFVDSSQRDELRMTLASEGLPANSTQGYELLDTLSGFGTTSQMFDAAYWRAKEGELARTIVSSPHISMARVHIASTGSNPFQRGVTPKASVSVTPSGAAITPQQGKAIRFLVSSAVAGLASEDVAVIDANGALIGNADEVAPTIGGEDKADVLKARVQRLLEARVGFGNSVVEVSVDTVTESEAIRERIFDPESRVAISTDTEERNTSSSEAGGGDVTVASNLPDQDGAGGENSSSQNNETRERVNYEVSETEREILREPGAIKRVTVAVLVNEMTITDEAGQETVTPRDESELEALRDLVASAVGFDEARGDIITIKSMGLQSVPLQGTAAGTSLMSNFNIDVMSAIQMAILALVTLILGLFVVRPLLARNDLNDAPAVAALPGATDGETDGLGLDGEIDGDDFQLPDLPVISDFGDASGELPDLNIGSGMSEDPVDRLRTMIGERQDETVEILRSWLEDKEESV